jgi:hypothetical protein
MSRSWPRYKVAIAIAIVTSGDNGHVSEPRFERAVTSLPTMCLTYHFIRQNARLVHMVFELKCAGLEIMRNPSRAPCNELARISNRSEKGKL